MKKPVELPFGLETIIPKPTGIPEKNDNILFRPSVVLNTIGFFSCYSKSYAIGANWFFICVANVGGVMHIVATSVVFWENESVDARLKENIVRRRKVKKSTMNGRKSND
jgi:hypothetical protein